MGIRNSLINHFNPLTMRNDIGALWENFCIAERLKMKHNHRESFNAYFWRTFDQKEIDYIEESGGQLKTFEFKFSSAPVKNKASKIFLDTYKGGSYEQIHRENIDTFLLSEEKT